MRRRDLLQGAIGLALAPAMGRAAIKPCPPAEFDVVGAGSVSTSCESGGAPGWFVDLPEKTWFPVASAVGERILDVQPNVSLGFGATVYTLATAWTGGAVDQERGELIFAANGGHTDYAGNEVYACKIRSSNPRWYRLNDPTPASMIKPALNAVASTSNAIGGQGLNPDRYAAMYSDGRMRPVHGWHSCQFSNGKIWYPYQSSPSGGGNSTPHAWMFDRGASGIPTSAEQSPLAWANNPGPWTWLGDTHSGSKALDRQGVTYGMAPCSAYDPVSQMIWTIEGYARRQWSSLSTVTREIKGSTIYPFSDNTGSDGMWGVVVYDAKDRWRFLVLPARYRKGLHILNLKAADPYVDSAWSVVEVSDSTVLTDTTGCGAVFHAPSQSILLGNPIGNYGSLGGDIISIRVPVNEDGSYAGGSWKVSRVTDGSGSVSPATGIRGTPPTSEQNGAWSKFNLIENMGNGQSALVVCLAIDRPTYVYKLPLKGV